MNPFFIGIAGGSGTGKTALARKLKKCFGRRASILHLDIYQKFGGNLPEIKGMKNWDHPEAINWSKLQKDLNNLREGKTIKIKVREQRRLKMAGSTTFYPTKIIIVEGYLLFYKKFIRRFLDFLIYLKASEKTRIKRRTKFKGKAGRYVREVVLLMHKKYIEPTKKYADLILSTDKYSVKQCIKKIIPYFNQLS